MDRIIIAASTHWDREWYRTFQEFQIRLCDLMNHLLDLLEQDQEFLCYTFDGQSVVLEDYLEIYPENKERIQRLARSGRLVFGPLYNLPDEFLSGGEALIRNFLLGEEACKEFGGAMKAGYVPDNFGHIAQLPQILQGVGIDTAFFFRGAHMDTIGHKEFYWTAPDGSKVLSEYMPMGYWSLKSWGKLGKTAEGHFKEACDTLKADSALNTFLLINGSDHLYQDPDFTSMVRKVREAFPEMEIRNGSIADYALVMKEAAKASEGLRELSGELRDFRYGPDPTGIASCRGRVKRLLWNTLAETERYGEPLAVLASRMSGGYSYPQGFFTKIWKQICISLGHDGVSGCSTDEVMRDIEAYLTHSLETGKRISGLALEEIGSAFGLPDLEKDEEYFLVFNPHPFAYSGITKQILYFERGDQPCKDFRIYDLNGGEIACELLSKEEDIITREFLYHSKEKVFRDKVTVNMKVEGLPPMGVCVFRVKKLSLMEKRKEELFTRLMPSRPMIENGYYRIEAGQDGSLTVTEKTGGKVYEGVNALVGRGESGDEYQHVSPLMDQHTFPRLTGLRVMANSPLSQTMRLTSSMEMPEGMTGDMLGRSSDSRTCIIVTEVSLYEGSDLIHFNVTIDNTCADHILYARFPAGFHGGREYSYVGFDETERDNRIFDFDPSLRSTQSVLKPMQNYAGVTGDDGGIQVIAKGIYEYHTKGEGGEREFYLTLLRSTGYLFHGLPLSWMDGQHSTTPIVKTKAARELGTSVLEYAVRLQRDVNANVAEQYLFPPRVASLGNGKPSGRENHASLFRMDNPKIGFSAAKRHQSKEGTVIRLYNRSSHVQELVLHTMGEIGECWQCNLLEEPETRLAAAGSEVALKIPGKKIITLYFNWRA